MNGFRLQRTDDDGTLWPLHTDVKTEQGILLQLPRDADISQAKHLLAIARENPGTPVDLVIMRENSIVWSARVSYHDRSTYNGR